MQRSTSPSRAGKKHFSFLNLPIEFYSPVSGGALSTIIAQTSRELLALGHEVSVLSAIDSNPPYDIGRVVPLRFPQRGEMSFLRGKISGLRKRLAGWDWPGFDAYLSAARSALGELPTPPDALIVFNDLVTQRYLRDWLPEQSAIFCWLQNEWRTQNPSLADTIAATDKFLTCSQYIADWTAKTHGIPASKFEVLHSGVDLSSFKPAIEPKPLSPTLNVVFVGRLDPNKGPDIAAEAVSRLQKEGLPVTFTVAGARWFYGGSEDEYTTSLKAKLSEINANYLGHVTRDKIASVYQAADVACVLSRSNEPFGLVTLEAMAAGCGVISSNRGGLPEACGNAAILVDPDDTTAVTNALRTLATNPSRLAELKAASLARAATASWRETAEKLLHIAATARQSATTPEAALA